MSYKRPKQVSDAKLERIRDYYENHNEQEVCDKFGITLNVFKNLITNRGLTRSYDPEKTGIQKFIY